VRSAGISRFHSTGQKERQSGPSCSHFNVQSCRAYFISTSQGFIDRYRRAATRHLVFCLPPPPLFGVSATQVRRRRRRIHWPSHLAKVKLSPLTVFLVLSCLEHSCVIWFETGSKNEFSLPSYRVKIMRYHPSLHLLLLPKLSHFIYLFISVGIIQKSIKFIYL
jgi:hypothetical protein